jgi:hypothetical protein
VTTPLRCAPALAAIDSTTVPFAFPLRPDWMPIQAAVVVAVHPHPVSVATSTERRPPGAPIESPLRLRSKRHGAAAWLTATRCEPTTMAEERDEGAGFAATEKATLASPCPLVAASDNHADSADADHEQSRVVETAIDPAPPDAGKLEAGAPPTLT